MQQPTRTLPRPSREGLTNFVLGFAAAGIIFSDLGAPHAGRAYVATTLFSLLVIRLWGAE